MKITSLPRTKGTSAQADKLAFGAKARAHFAGFIGTSEDVPLTKQTCAEVSENLEPTT
jgi:hypothetical protein